MWRRVLVGVGFSKLLHWRRHNPAKRSDFASAFEHCDMVAATLWGRTDPRNVKRSICGMGHKWLWEIDGGVELTYLSKDGKAGYPGNLSVVDRTR
jgi:L-ribulokinase